MVFHKLKGLSQVSLKRRVSRKETSKSHKINKRHE